MDLPVEHLATLAAVVDEGSFDAAAQRLHVTPSAVSQRIRALEDRVGTVLLQRTRPVRVTESGVSVVRAARQIAQIANDVTTELGHGSANAVMQIAVNADSLATWFLPAIARAARETRAHFELVRSDETLSRERLRTGEVLAALTSVASPVPGCTSTCIGVDRYVGIASPEFAARHFPDGVDHAALQRTTVVEFDRDDVLERRFIRRITRAALNPPRHLVPSSWDFVRAVELGMGWGVAPRLLVATALDAGRLVEIAPGITVEVKLHWQRWNLNSPALNALTTIVLDEAAVALGAPRRRDKESDGT